MSQTQFSIELGKQMNRNHATAPWLSRKSGVPKGTLHKWLSIGRTPRDWQPIVEIGRVLDLTLSEMDGLLASAKKSSVSKLKQTVTEPNDIALLGHWQGPFLAPHAPDVIVGRNDTIAQASTILTRTIPENSRTKRICMVQGMGGVGKTTIARQIVHQVKDQFAEGVLWATLQEDNPDSLLAILKLFAHVCGIDLPNKLPLDVLSQRVRTALAGRQILIVLDDVQTGQQIDQIWPGGNDGALLLTARERAIHTPFGTERIALMPFDAKTDATLELFREHLGKQRVERETETFAKIADLIDHLPLAATIVAQRLKLEDDWSAAEFLDEELRPERARLEALKHDDLSVRLSFNVSYQSLPPPRQRYFSELGVFEGQPFTVEAAAHILDLPLRSARSILRDLNHRALVQKTQSGRYQLHLLLSQYARDFLSGKQTYNRKVQYYVGYAQAHKYDESKLFPELDSIRIALDNAHEQQIEHEFVHGVAATYFVLFEHGLHQTVGNFLTKAVEITKKNNQPQLTAHLLTQMSHFSLHTGKQDEAELLIAEADSLAEGVTRASVNRFKAQLNFQSNAELAIDPLLSAIEIAKEHGQVEELATLCENIAQVYLSIGQLDEASPFIQDCLEIAEKTGNIRQRIKVLMLQGTIARRKGEYQLASDVYEQALYLAHKMKNPIVLQVLYTYHGNLLRLMGRNIASLNYYEMAKEKVDKPYYQMHVQVSMADVLITLGDYAQANLYLQEGVRIAEKREQTVGKALLLLIQGRYLLYKNQDIDAAEQHFSEALTIANEYGDVEDMLDASLALGDAQLKLGDAESAATHFTNALEKAEASQYAAETELARYGLARVTYMRGDHQQAIEAATQSYDRLKEMSHFQAKGIKVWLRQIAKL